MSWNIVEDLRPKAERDRSLMGKHRADIRQKVEAKQSKRRPKRSRKREVR